MAVAEHDSRIGYAVQHALVLVARPGGEALDVREWRAVDVEHPVKLDLRLQRVQPALVRAEPGVRLSELFRDLRTVERRLAQPALTVAADPRRLRQRTQALDRLEGPRRPRCEVTPEEKRICARALGVLEDRVEGNEIAVDVVQDREHPSLRHRPGGAA